MSWSRSLAKTVLPEGDLIASVVPLQHAPVERKVTCPWRWERCGIPQPRRTHPETENDEYAASDLNQMIRELGFREVLRVLRKNGHSRTDLAGLPRGCQQGCGERPYLRSDRDHRERSIPGSIPSVQALNSGR